MGTEKGSNGEAGRRLILNKMVRLGLLDMVEFKLRSKKWKEDNREKGRMMY